LTMPLCLRPSRKRAYVIRPSGNYPRIRLVSVAVSWNHYISSILLIPHCWVDCLIIMFDNYEFLLPISSWLISDPKTFYRKQLVSESVGGDLTQGATTASALFRTQLQSSGSIEQVDSPRKPMEMSNTGQKSNDQSVSIVLPEPRVCCWVDNIKYFIARMYTKGTVVSLSFRLIHKDNKNTLIFHKNGHNFWTNHHRDFRLTSKYF
jgi:hypothetical protein